MNDFINMMTTLQMTISNSVGFLCSLSLFLFSILILNQIIAGRLSLLGIYPRHLIGMPGIFFAPFIHANFNHLFFNLFPLIVLTVLLLPFGYDFYWNLTCVLIIFSGTLIWCFARPGLHVGASSLITAYWGFFIMQAFVANTVIYNWFTGFICIYYFFGIFFGIFPSEDRVSWEGHLFGLIAGMSTSYLAHLLPIVNQFIFTRPFFFKIPQHFI